MFHSEHSTTIEWHLSHSCFPVSIILFLWEEVYCIRRWRSRSFLVKRTWDELLKELQLVGFTIYVIFLNFLRCISDISRENHLFVLTLIWYNTIDLEDLIRVGIGREICTQLLWWKCYLHKLLPFICLELTLFFNHRWRGKELFFHNLMLQGNGRKCHLRHFQVHVSSYHLMPERRKNI